MTMMTKLKTLSVIFLLATHTLHSQPAPQLSAKPPALLPPSPDAFQFARYGNLPIGLNTGAAQFGLPVYTVRSGGLSHAVSLGYSTNGIKVDEQAGRTGLGWSLRAGGVVTRTVMDKPDGGGGVQPTYYHGNTTSFSGNWPLYNYVSGASNQTPPDYQPDEYSFSVDGLSGKFMRRENGDFAQFSGSGVRIEKNANGFLLTAPNGVRYRFYLSETAQNRSGGSPNATLQWVPAPEPTAWYLTKITAPNGDAIDFDYGYMNGTGNHGVTYHNGISQEYSTTEMSTDGMHSNAGYQRIRYDGANGGATPGCPNVGGLATTVQLTDNTPRCLRSISFAGGTVRFSYSGREDAPGEQKLDSVQVFRSGDNYRLACTVLGYAYSVAALGPFDTQVANYNYTDANPHLRKRLFLANARELGANNEAGPAHAFEYNDINGLPPRLSFAQDRYGGFNGKANGQYFFPNDTWLDWHIGNNGFGADRGYSFAHAQKGALSKITYPTGGYTQIGYRPNKIDGGYAFKVKSDSVWAVLDTSTVAGQEAWGDTIHHFGGNLRLRASCNWASVPLDGAGPGGTYSGISGTWYVWFYLVDVATGQCVIKACGKRVYPGETAVDGHFGFGLAPGVYRIRMLANMPNLRARVSLERWSKVADHGPDAGIAGIRVASLTDYTDAGKVAGGRSYLYGDWGDSTGSSGTGLRSDNGFNGAEIGFTEIFDGNATCGYNTIGSSSVASNFLTDNGTVFYTKVVELPMPPNAGAMQNAGATEHEFYYSAKKTAIPLVFSWYVGGWAETMPLPTAPGAPLMNNDFLTGMPRAVRTFTYGTLHGPRTIVNETVNHYSVDTANLAIDTFLVSRYARPMPDNGGMVVTNIPAGYQTFFYHFDIYRYWRYFGFAKLDSTVTADYSGTVPLINKTVFGGYSPRNFQPRVIGYGTSNGNTKTILRRYAGDILPAEPGHGTVYNPMVNANMVDALVEETVLENGNEMLKKRMAYIPKTAPGGNTQYLPFQVYSSQNGQPEEAELIYQLYDSTGNLLQYSDKSGLVTSIIWGYGGRYPVAKVTGITYNDAMAQAMMDMAIVNGPATDAALQAELNKLRNLPGTTDVVTRTYTPLVGVTTETGPRGQTVYYQYDAFNRLKAIKDADGNTVKGMGYWLQTNPGL
jgi:YD repeat-containing protein